MSDESPFFRSSPCLGGCRRWNALYFQVVVIIIVAACRVSSAQSGSGSLNRIDSSKPISVPIGFENAFQDWNNQVEALSKAIAKALSEKSKYGENDVIALVEVNKTFPAIRQAIAKVKVDKDGGKITEGTAPVKINTKTGSGVPGGWKGANKR